MNKRRQRRKHFLLFFFLLLILFLGLIFSTSYGSVGFLFKNLESARKEIIFNIRLPRSIMACLLGGALSLSGFLLQTYFQNPIAGPFILGISSGSKMTVALYTVFFLARGIKSSSLGIIFSSFLGAIVSTFFILIAAKKIKRTAALLLAGIMSGYISSAITDFVIATAQDSQIANIHGWSKGSFSGTTWDNCFYALLIIVPVVFLTFLFSKQIGAYRLGEDYAKSMGLRISFFRIVLILLSSTLSATVTAFAGPISFIGIAAPFCAKKIFNTADPFLITPASFISGAIFCLFCDLLSRILLAPVELNISIVTSFLGSPLVLYILVQKHKKGGNYSG